MKKPLITIILFYLLHYMFFITPSFSQVMAGGGEHSLILCNTGTVMSFGNNEFGQLGNGTTSSQQLTPVLVSGLNDVIAVACGSFHSLFLKNDGTVWACGNNYYGQLGDGTSTERHTPVQVIGLNDITAIACGSFHSLFLKSDSTVWACGYNEHGQLGDGTTSSQQLTPIQAIGLSGVTHISAGYYFSLFLKNDGAVWACGNNDYGQLGDGTTTELYIPTQIFNLIDITDISAGYYYSLFLKNDSTVWACGVNFFGQLGDGTTNDQYTPVIDSSLNGIIDIEAGYDHSMFLKNDSSVWACGNNTECELGDGTLIDRHTPVQVSISSDIIAIEAGAEHCLFLKNNDNVWACGANLSGELGDGTTTNRCTPIQGTELCQVTNATIFVNDIGLFIYPNPTFGKINVKTEDVELIEIFDLQGNKIFNCVINEIDLSQEPRGIYFIKVITKNKSIIKKIIKL